MHSLFDWSSVSFIQLCTQFSASQASSLCPFLCMSWMCIYLWSIVCMCVYVFQSVPVSRDCFCLDMLIRIDYFGEFLLPQGRTRLPSGFFLMLSTIGLLIGGRSSQCRICGNSGLTQSCSVHPLYTRNQGLSIQSDHGPVWDITTLSVAKDSHPVWHWEGVLHVGLQVKNLDVCRFLWYEDPTKPVMKDNLAVYLFKRVHFGMISSPFFLEAALYYHLRKDSGAGLGGIRGPP